MPTVPENSKLIADATRGQPSPLPETDIMARARYAVEHPEVLHTPKELRGIIAGLVVRVGLLEAKKA